MSNVGTDERSSEPSNVVSAPQNNSAGGASSSTNVASPTAGSGTPNNLW